MILTKLSLNNIGLFCDTQVIDFSPSVKDHTSKSIVLIGGRNGVGKTTIFEAIRLCLYGQAYDARNMAKTEYIAKINDLFHQNKNGLHPTSAFVELEFTLTHTGRVEVYTVKRIWNRSTSGITEKLIVKRNEERIDDFEATIWQDFLKEIIPPSISKLFFFDGEKIQQLAEDRQDREYISDSFKALLGLELLERLQTDLSLYISREVKNIKNGDASGLASILSEIETLNSGLGSKAQERAEKQAIKDHLKGKIEDWESKISGKGGDLLKDREKSKLAKSKLEGEIQACEQQIRDLSASLLPFSLAPGICKELENTIMREEGMKRRLAYNEVLTNKLANLGSEILENTEWKKIKIKHDERDAFVSAILANVESSLKEPISEKEIALVHDLSENERTNISSWTQTATERSSKDLLVLCKNLEDLSGRQQNLEKKLKMVPLDDVLSPGLKALQDFNHSLGQVEEQIKIIDREIQTLRDKLLEDQRRIASAREHLKGIDALDTKLKLANSVIDVLQEYAVSLKQNRIGLLEEKLRECFNQLSWKDEPVRAVRIDPVDFSIKIYDHEGNCIQKHMLSAGEKQVFAISMLWALTKASSRHLPFIIDTPLGRLDSEHRGRLVADFFPNAGHQTIILSTDTEIDKEYFTGLEPYIARSYRLKYNKKEKKTTIDEGYFWKVGEEQ